MDLRISDITSEEVAALTSSLINRKRELLSLLSTCIDRAKRRNFIAEGKAIDKLLDKILLDID